MGNCLSKIPKGHFQLYKKEIAECASTMGRVYTPRYDDVMAMGCHVRKRVCKTPVADIFPPQACDLEWKNKVSRHVDKNVKGNDRAIWL